MTIGHEASDPYSGIEIFAVPRGSGKPTEYYLYFGRKSIDSTDVKIFGTKREGFRIDFQSQAIADEFCQWRAEAIPEYIRSFSVPLDLGSELVDGRLAFWRLRWDQVYQNKVGASAKSVTMDGLNAFRIDIWLRPKLLTWRQPWTANDFMKEVQRVVESMSEHEFAWKGLVQAIKTEWVLEFRVPTDSSSLAQVAKLARERLKDVVDFAVSQLSVQVNSDSVVMQFDFPPSISTACEQYLLYFVQFLADLGIQAEAEVQHKAAEVLFRVTPTDGPEALDRIREALNTYLQLPTDPSFAVAASQEQDLAVRQLEFNVHQLKGQLMLAQMYLEAKDAKIEALELSNYQLRQIAGGEVQMIGKGRPPAAGEEDTEAIIDGIVSVKDVEKGGVVLHTPEILRRLKRRFGR